eukprot:3293519-Rhodomonas_salina.1
MERRLHCIYCILSSAPLICDGKAIVWRLTVTSCHDCSAPRHRGHRRGEVQLGGGGRTRCVREGEGERERERERAGRGG